jgi:hypothetical protein
MSNNEQLKQDYEDICKAGFNGSFEDYLNYLASFSKVPEEVTIIRTLKLKPGDIVKIDDLRPVRIVADGFGKCKICALKKNCSDTDPLCRKTNLKGYIYFEEV